VLLDVIKMIYAGLVVGLQPVKFFVDEIYRKSTGIKRYKQPRCDHLGCYWMILGEK